MLKILSIGNSFSQNAQRYVWGIADAAGIEIHNVNLYIGGCSFERHATNVRENLADYLFEEHGKGTGRYVTLKDALLSDEWDIITVQEVSTRSYDVTKFEPFMSEVMSYVRELCPKAKIMLHMTWGYGSEERLQPRHFENMRAMYERIKVAYKEAAKIIGADGVIPSGEAMQRVSDAGYTVHSDGAHANNTVGEYSLGLLWIKKLFGVSVVGNGFRGFKAPMEEEVILDVQKIVDGIDTDESAIFG